MRLTRTRLLLAGALCALPATTTTAHAAPVPLRCGLEDVASTPLADVSLDVTTGRARWDVAAPVPGPAYSVTPHPAWVVATDADWINTQPTYDSTVTPNTFRTTFTLVPELLHRSLEIEFAADNGVTFYLNGGSIGGYDPPPGAPLPDQLAAYQELHPLAYSGPLLQDGLNVLDAVVNDDGFATGLLVHGAVHGCAVRGLSPTTCVEASPTHVVTYSPASLDVHTDATWRTGALGTGPAYAVAPYPNSWYPPTAPVTWISVAPDRYGPAHTTYRTSFTLPADFSYGGVVLQFASDNDVAITLNGVPIGGNAGGPADPSAFRLLHTISLAQAPLVVGVNELRADVTDYGTVTGFLLQGGVYACRTGEVL